MENTIEFIGMGTDAKDTDIGNYRIKADFKNEKGDNCFVEIAHFYQGEELHGMVRQAYILNGKDKKHLFLSFDDMYNSTCKYDLESVIQKVNALFKCKFTNATVVKFSTNTYKVGSN